MQIRWYTCRRYECDDASATLYPLLRIDERRDIRYRVASSYRNVISECLIHFFRRTRRGHRHIITRINTTKCLSSSVCDSIPEESDQDASVSRERMKIPTMANERDGACVQENKGNFVYYQPGRTNGHRGANVLFIHDLLPIIYLFSFIIP